MDLPVCVLDHGRDSAVWLWKGDLFRVTNLELRPEYAAFDRKRNTWQPILTNRAPVLDFTQWRIVNGYL